jgi:UDP-N-acetylmuramoyl-L-alanyl-D-glutamate--2,6-diaminopimelate ligase
MAANSKVLTTSAITECLCASDQLISASVQPASTIASITTDSRKVDGAACFIAYRGVRTDGHQFVPSVRAKYNCLVIVDDPKYFLDDGRTILVHQSRAAWAHLCALLYDNPQKRLTCIGVTGTNGKTSSVWFCRELLQAAGIRAFSIGTLGFVSDTGIEAGTHTTPDPDQLYAKMQQMLARGYTHCVMEASSHASIQCKLEPIRFSAVAFTSFSRDHLDFHPTMASYFAAKRRFFTELATKDATRIVHESVVAQNFESLGEGTMVYGRSAAATAKLQVRKEPGKAAVTLQINDWSAETALIDSFQVENLACACLLFEAVNGRMPAEPTIKSLQPVPGRIEPVLGKQGAPTVLVDYAHTPDALEKALGVARSNTLSRLLVVFGCGGDRDPGKRPEMGRVAAKLADLVYITSDNPRSEDPETIAKQIASGVGDLKPTVIDVDRASAIKRAIAEAGAGDFVLIAGKGHENYQIIGKETKSFDDREVARSALRDLGY